MCSGASNSPDDYFLDQQDHRNISHLWENVLTKNVDLNEGFLECDDDDSDNDDSKQSKTPDDEFGKNPLIDCASTNIKDPYEIIQKKLAKGKAFLKKRSPLQKFDEIVTRELTNFRKSEENPQLSRSPSQSQAPKTPDFPPNLLSVHNKMSRGVLRSVEKDVKEDNLAEVENEILMDAIEKLAQAQAFCRFDEAVKAAEAATAAVPPDQAEEVAVKCAQDYQSEIVDIINENVSFAEEKKPIEVIGYIGVTKLKDNM